MYCRASLGCCNLSVICSSGSFTCSCNGEGIFSSISGTTCMFSETQKKKSNKIVGNLKVYFILTRWNEVCHWISEVIWVNIMMM